MHYIIYFGKIQHCILNFGLKIVHIKVLVVAPLRVARDTWSAEIEKWEHLKNLRYSVDVGSEQERISALRTPANIYIINRENIQWLVEESGLTLGQLLPSISIWR